MKKKIIAQAVCAILIFIAGFAYGGYRGSYRVIEQRNVGDLNWYNTFHMMGREADNKKMMRFSAQGINMVVQFLREAENGANSYPYWLSAFPMEDNQFLDDAQLKGILNAFAEYPISNVPELTEENLAYLKSKRE